MQKVLIITYYWPPAGGPGVQRWLKFVKYLPEFEITPVVFVPKNAAYPIKDESLLDEIPNDIDIIEQPIFEPYGVASIFTPKKTKRISSGIIEKEKKQSFIERILLWIRGNLFIPDARKFWVQPSVKKLSSIIKSEHIDRIITTGPPHSVHLIGLELKKRHNIGWTADFRDPWTTIGYHKKLKLTKASKRKHKELEKIVLDSADTVIVTSETTKKEFSLITETPISVITNGFDQAAPEVALDAKFTLSHIGSLLTERNPMVLWQALKELIVENPALAGSLRIQLIGVVGEAVRDALNQNGLAEYVDFKGYIPHNEVTICQAKSQVLLLLEIDTEETRGIIPGKFFEYLNARRPVLAIGPKNWEAGQMIEEQKAGKYFTPKQKTEIKQILLQWFSAYKEGVLESNTTEIEQFHRRNLTKKLANLL